MRERSIAAYLATGTLVMLVASFGFLRPAVAGDVISQVVEANSPDAMLAAPVGRGNEAIIVAKCD